MNILFQLCIYIQELYFFLYDSITYMYHNLYHHCTNIQDDPCGYYTIHPKTKLLQYSVHGPSSEITYFIYFHQVTEKRIISIVNTLYDPNIIQYHHQISKCFLSIIVRINNMTPIELYLDSSFYYTGNAILSSIFLMYYLHKHHSMIVTSDFLYTVECMDHNLNVIELTRDSYIQLGLDYQYSIITIPS
jgi:hypothetical protein